MEYKTGFFRPAPAGVTAEIERLLNIRLYGKSGALKAMTLTEAEAGELLQILKDYFAQGGTE